MPGPCLHHAGGTCYSPGLVIVPEERQGNAGPPPRRYSPAVTAADPGQAATSGGTRAG
jgi:hypothetical protein